MEEKADNKAGILDSISKTTAIVLIAVYASGFIVVSLRNTAFGFTSSNPFRVEVLCAGTWLAAFLSFPVCVALWTYFYFKRIFSKQPKFDRLLQHLLFFQVICVTTSLFVAGAFNLPIVDPRIGVPEVVLGAVFIISGGFAFSARSGHAMFAVINALLAMGSAVTIAGLMQARGPQFQTATLFLWFFVLGLTFMLMILQLSLQKDNPLLWPPTLIVVSGAVLIFATLIYPHIKRAWGGGELIPVVLYLKDSPITAHYIRADLVDESDKGLFVIPRDQHKAIFIPDSSVQLIYYSDTADTTLMTGK